MLADAGAPAVLALTPLAVVLADAGAPEVVAPAPDAVMLADAGAPAVLALAPLAVVLAFLAPPPRLRCASRWKGPLVNWAQQRECVRRKDSLHTGQARAQSSSAARSGAGAADADMARLGHALMTVDAVMSHCSNLRRVINRTGLPTPCPSSAATPRAARR